jgi:predicted DNA-binding transcriptional regulator AlpA
VWASSKRYPLRFIKIGRSVRYSAADIAEFIRLRTVPRDGTRSGE